MSSRPQASPLLGRRLGFLVLSPGVGTGRQGIQAMWGQARGVGHPPSSATLLEVDVSCKQGPPEHTPQSSHPCRHPWKPGQVGHIASAPAGTCLCSSLDTERAR